MAVAHRFNPPPNWPAPPEGWTPPPGWEPDPTWGPPPEGWQLWVSYRPNRDAWKWSLLSAVVLLVVFLGIGSALAQAPPPPEVVGVILGRELVAALIVGLVAYFRSGRWPWWFYLLAVLGVSVVLNVISVAGQVGASA